MFYDNVHTPYAYNTFLAKHVLFNMLICDFVDIPLFVVVKALRSLCLCHVSHVRRLNKYSVSVSVSVIVSLFWLRISMLTEAVLTCTNPPHLKAKIRKNVYPCKSQFQNKGV